MLQFILVVVFVWFVVDKCFQNLGLGCDFVQDVVKCVIVVVDFVGIWGMIVYVISQEVKVFYQGCGFLLLLMNEMILMILLGDLKVSI